MIKLEGTQAKQYGDRAYEAGRAGRIKVSAVTDFPEPDSPTTPSVSPSRIESDTPSTARTTRSSV